jgi:hypothetical protein
VLGSCEWSNEWRRDAIGNGANHDHPSAGQSEQRQKGLRDGKLTIHVDLELRAEFVQRHKLQWPCQADAGVVDQRIQASLADMLGDRLGSQGNLILAGDIHAQRRDLSDCLDLQPLSIFGPTHAGKDVHAAPSEPQCNRPTHSARGAGNQRVWLGAVHRSGSFRVPTLVCQRLLALL